jgi:hypothetical protein
MKKLLLISLLLVQVHIQLDIKITIDVLVILYILKRIKLTVVYPYLNFASMPFLSEAPFSLSFTPEHNITIVR